jgi:arginine N-succinyltransferase
MLLVRSARSADHSDFVELAGAAGPGFTSLAVDNETLAERLAGSEAAFRGEVSDKSDACYQLMIEESETGAILGTAAVKAAVGIKKPYFDFKILTIAQASREADRRFDMDVMLLVNDFAGCTEVGSLFVRDAARGTGAGRLIAQSRYLLIAAAPERYGPRIVSELRGVVDEAGHSPFFEHVTRPFFRMSFEEADRLSASTDNQFILDLMPAHPIYLDLLPEPARAVIGKTHDHGVNARRLLEWEGFRFNRYVDIFDGGPLMSCDAEEARTRAESRLLPVGPVQDGEQVEAIVTNDRAGDFRATFTSVRLGETEVGLEDEARRLLDITEGDRARIWVRR